MSGDFDPSRIQERHLYDGLEEAPCIGEKLLLRGPAGNIEAVTSYPSVMAKEFAIAVICHPHPLHEGSMANKVVHVLSETFNGMGAPALRFNFRGVGRSDGEYAQGIGEAEDLMAVVRWFRARHPGAPLWLSGFSFGAYVVMRAHSRLGPQRLLLVAPPVSLFEFDSLPPVSVPWLIVQGGRDEIVKPLAVQEWVSRQPHPPLFRFMNDADHFFHGRMNRLRRAVEQGWARLG